MMVLSQNDYGKRLLPYGMIFPAMFFIIVFGLIPIIDSFATSLVQWNFINAKVFVGLGNYLDLLLSGDFLKVLANTCYFTVLNVPLTMLLALALAMLLNGPVLGKKFFRALFFSPWVIPTVNVAILWMYILEPDYGMLNWFLELLGLGGISWLASTRWALPAIVFISVWKGAGYFCLLYLAGLQNIPRQLYEASAMDGANPWRQFLRVTLPMLSPTTLFVLIVSVIDSFSQFDLVAVMTGGGPANRTNLLVYYLYERAFVAFKAGSASAVAMIVLGILMIFTFAQFKLSDKWVHY
jgi:multiple sugar transport system permease protein